MINETVSSGTKNNGKNTGESQSNKKENQQSAQRETVALNCYEEPIKITWNELRVEIVIEPSHMDDPQVIFQGREALQIIRWFQSL